MKGAKTETEMTVLHQNIKNLTINGFPNITWDLYLTQKSESLNHRPDHYLNGLLSKKWKGQDPAVRLRYKQVRNPNTKPDGIQRIHTKSEANDYLRRMLYRDSIFDVPIREVRDRFGIWSEDR